MKLRQRQIKYFNYVVQKYGGSWKLVNDVLILENENDYFYFEHIQRIKNQEKMIYIAWHKNTYGDINGFHKQACLANLNKLFFRCATHKLRCIEGRQYCRRDFTEDFQEFCHKISF